MARTSCSSLAKESKKETGPKSIVMWPERSSWKVVGRKRDCSDIGWSDVSQCQACQLEEDRLYHCPEWHEIRIEIPDAFRKWEQKASTLKKKQKWLRGIIAHPPSESHWNGGYSSVKEWESEKPKS